MKKISVILAAAAVAVAAQAENAPLRTPAARTHTPKTLSCAPLQASGFEEGTMKAARKATAAPSLEQLAGSWTFAMGDFYYDDSANAFIALDYNATVNVDTLVFNGAKASSLTLKATYNQSTATLSFPHAFAGIYEGYYLYQQPFTYNWETGQTEYIKALTGTYDPDLGMMITDIPDSGILWIAFQGKTQAGVYNCYDIPAATFNDAVLPDLGSWNDVGNATFMDGWVMPGFDMDQLANQYEVPLQQNADNANLYRLVNPYKYGPLAQYNDWKGDGYIVFDVSDPDHVVFKTSPCGFSNLEMGILTFYCYNQLGMLSAYYPQYSIAEIVNLQDGWSPWTTFNDGIVLLSSIVDKQNKLVYDANYGYQAQPLGGYIWVDKYNQPMNMNARILFPGADGVSGVEADEDAPVEFFNLQGVRVASPEAGSLVIKRQGAKSSKILVK